MNDPPEIATEFAPAPGVSLESVLTTDELGARPSRAPDYQTESRGLLTLMQHLADSPRTILQRLVEIALETCLAGSAGVSVVSEESGDFYWPAIAGEWKPHIGGGTPRDFGPCGVVLDRDAVQLFTHPERYYPYLVPVSPPIEEALLTPFHVGAKAVGTVWVIAHDQGRKFDAEDQRLLESLGRFAATAYTVWAALDAQEQHARTLREVNEALMLSSVRQHELTEQMQEQAAALSDLHRRKDEFLAMLSHELRNPLAPIANAVQLLRLQKDESQLQQLARTIIERQVGQLTRLVDDLLEVSRITTGRIHLHQERVTLNGVVVNAVETVRPLIGHCRHALKTSLSPQPILLYGDAARLEQVVVNLLTNAAKYTEVGGHIWLSVQQEGDEAVLRVRDTGVGIAPELLPRIFDLFTQAERSLDRSEGGLGIGLCLVQRLVELHRGRVEAYSALGQGSEFVVRLPVMATSVPQLSATTTEAAQPTASLRVLVVDDNVDAAQSLAMLLRASRQEVRTAHDGPTALEAALAYRPDVVLLDIGLPGLNGYEVAKRIRQQPVLQNVVLVAMTGYGQETDQQRSQEAGFDHHLVKPADFGKVQKILATVSEQAT